LKTISKIAQRKFILPLFLAVVTGLVATGCQTYQSKNHSYNYWIRGDLTNAVVEATKAADKKTNTVDAIIFRLEHGAALRANGQYEDSNRAFDRAQEKIDDFAQKSKVSIGRETAAMLSNQASLPYRGRAYDGIMLNTYMALNYLQLGEPDKARPELIRAYQRQQDAVTDNQRRIEKAQSEMADQQPENREIVEKAQNNLSLKAKLNASNSGLDNLKPYADYVNPFTVYLDGLFFMADAADGSDLERARKSFERVLGFDPDNEYVKQDLAMVNDLINGKPLPPTTYVIFETGCAPIRNQIRIDIPTFWPQMPYLGAAFPTLKPQGNYLPSLTVTAQGVPVTTGNTTTTVSDTNPTVTSTTTTAGDTNAVAGSTPTTVNDTNATANNTPATTGDTNTTIAGTTPTASDTNATTDSRVVTTGSTNITSTETKTTVTSTTTIITNITATTSLVASMDSVVGQDFKNELPIIITKTLLSTAIKATATHFAWEATRQKQQNGTLDNGGIPGMLVILSCVTWQAANNIADERTWMTLPKEFQVCRFSTPPDRKIVLETPVGTQKIPVTIGDGTIILIYVKSITATNPLLVTQMKLK